MFTSRPIPCPASGPLLAHRGSSHMGPSGNRLHICKYPRPPSRPTCEASLCDTCTPLRGSRQTRHAARTRLRTPATGLRESRSQGILAQPAGALLQTGNVIPYENSARGSGTNIFSESASTNPAPSNCRTLPRGCPKPNLLPRRILRRSARQRPQTSPDLPQMCALNRLSASPGRPLNVPLNVPLNASLNFSSSFPS